VARTRAEDYDDKQQYILDSAADLFARKGFVNASINDIAAACKMSKSALYHYHKSKEAILFAILSTHVRKVLAEARAAIADVGDARLRLTRFIESLMDNYATARSKHIVLLNETGSLADAEQREVRELGRKLVALAIEVLTPINPELMAKRQLRKPYAMFFYGMVNWTYTWYDAGGSLSPRELSHRIAALFLDGFTSAVEIEKLRPGRQAVKV
jgi:AcrR family transcriptional regulator